MDAVEGKVCSKIVSVNGSMSLPVPTPSNVCVIPNPSSPPQPLFLGSFMACQCIFGVGTSCEGDVAGVSPWSGTRWDEKIDQQQPILPRGARHGEGVAFLADVGVDLLRGINMS